MISPTPMTINTITATYQRPVSTAARTATIWPNVSNATTGQTTSPIATPSANGYAPLKPFFKLRAINATQTGTGVIKSKARANRYSPIS